MEKNIEEEKCKNCGSVKDDEFWEYCPFCGDAFPEYEKEVENGTN